MRENTKVMWFGLYERDKSIDNYIVTVSNIINVYCTKNLIGYIQRLHVLGLGLRSTWTCHIIGPLGPLHIII